MYEMHNANPYQNIANQLPGDVTDSGIISARGQGPRMRDYYGHPTNVAYESLTSPTVDYGLQPARRIVRRTGRDAAAEAYASSVSQELQLRGLGSLASARSGSLTRHLRVSKVPVESFSTPDGYGLRQHGLGATELPKNVDWATSCQDLDWEKYGPAVVGYAMQDTDPAKQAARLVEAFEIFGTTVVGCVTTVGTARMIEAGLIPSDPDAREKVIAQWGKQAKRVSKLPGGWKKDSWEWKWWLLSGHTAWYKNPLILGAGAIGGVYLYKNRKKLGI